MSKLMKISRKAVTIGLCPYNGTVDTSQSDFYEAEILLQPLVSFVKSQMNSEFDIWKLLNSLYSGYFWFILSDLGQSSPTTTYNDASQFFVPSNFSQPVLYPSTNNIILNATLAKAVFTDIGSSGTDETVLAVVTTPNRSIEGDPKFRRIYLCNQRRLKQWMDLLVSVFGLSFSLLASCYAFGLIILRWMVDRDKTKHKTGRSAIVYRQSYEGNIGNFLFTLFSGCQRSKTPGPMY